METLQQEFSAESTSSTVPLAERLRYGSSFHQQLVGRIRARLDLGNRHISQRYDDWDRADEHLQLYIDLSRRARKSDRTTDPNKREMPFQRAIVVPIAHAVLQVRLTALMALFSARDPMIQLEGRGPEDVQPAKIFEALTTYDLQQMQSQLVMYGFFKNVEKYGLGIITDSFCVEPGWVQQSIPVQSPIELMIMQALNMPTTQRIWGVTREFVRWEVVDPYMFCPDPRVPGSHIQDMEFIGHGVYRAYTYLLARTQDNGGLYINVEHLRRAAHQRRDQSGRRRSTIHTGSIDLRDTADDRDRGVYLLEHLQVRLVPREWGLGDESRPEIWQFVLAEDAVIVQAERRTNEHGHFSYSVAQTDYDPHNAFAPGMVENLDGFQRLANWLYASHIENTQKVLNDALIYGPSFIEENDLLNPGPGRHVRLSRKGEELVERGMLNIPQMITQLAVTDITAGHLREVQQIYDMVQRMTGINDPASGQPTNTKRTLGEIDRILVSSSRRLATQAHMYDAQAIQPLVLRMIADRQQYTSREQFVRISGRLAQELKQERLLTTRDNIQGNFDYIPVSGTMPPDPERGAESWVDLLTLLSKAPQLIQPGPDGRVLDFRWVFKQFATARGIKDIEDAYIQVMPPGAMQAGVQAGNMIPPGMAPPGGPIPGAGIPGRVVPGGIPGGPPRNGVPRI